MAEVILCGVSVGVEYVRRVVDQPRLFGIAVEQVVEIAVHTQQQIGTTFGNHIQKHPFPFGQIFTRRNADLEFEAVRFVIVKNASPKSHIIIPLYKNIDQSILSVCVTGGDRLN